MYHFSLFHSKEKFQQYSYLNYKRVTTLGIPFIEVLINFLFLTPVPFCYFSGWKWLSTSAVLKERQEQKQILDSLDFIKKTVAENRNKMIQTDSLNRVRSSGTCKFNDLCTGFPHYELKK